MTSITRIFLFKQRRRLFLGILGVAIASSLISAIAMMNDSLSASTLDIVTDNVGAGDLIFTHQTSFTVGDDFSFPEDEVQEYIDVPEILDYYPRVMDFVDTRGGKDVGIDNVQDFLGEWQTQLIFYGIDVEKERAGKLGKFFLNGTHTEFTNVIYKNHCLLLEPAARLLGVEVGDIVETRFTNNTLNLTVQAIVTQEAKFTAVERNLIITNLVEAQWLLRRIGRINYLIATLRDSEQYYNTRNLDQGIDELRDIGMRVDAQLPDEDYSFYMPKLTIINLSEIIFVPLSIFYWFVTIISMIITGLLIFGVVSTSSEEMIYELGILRVVGAKKRASYKIMLAQGIVISLVGTTLGLLLAMAYTPFILDFVFHYFAQINQPIPLTVLPGTLLQSYLLVFFLVLSVTLVPARKAANRLIADAIAPYRSTDAKFHVEKEGSPNLKMVVIGIAMALLGLLLFTVLPSFVATLDYFLLLMVFLVLLIMTLVGLVLVTVVLVPFIEQVLTKFIRRIARRSGHVIEFSLKRYGRRNLTTTLMFAFSFTFVFFIGSQTCVLQDTIVEFLDYQYGSELVMAKTTTADEGKILDDGLLTQVEGLPHITQIVPVMHNSLDLTLLLNGQLAELQLQLQNDDKLDVTAGDYINYHTTQAGLIGVTKDYSNLVDIRDILFTGGDLTWKQAFSSLFSANDTCILSTAVADFIGIGPGETLRLTFRNGSSVVAKEFQVSGIAARLPGFWNFRQSWYSTFSGGVLLSLDVYRELMNISRDTAAYDQYDKLLISLDRNDLNTVEDTKTEIDKLVGEEYQYVLDDNYSKTVLINRHLETFSAIMEVILFLSIIISMFGLFSSTQNKVMERQREIGIIQSLGLRKSETRNMFIIEAIVSLLASGILGTLIGLSLTWLIKFEFTYLLEIPFRITLPWLTIFWVYGIALGGGILGLYFLIRKEFQKPPLEFFYRVS